MVDPGGSRQNLTFPTGDGTSRGCLVVPRSGSGPGVLVAQERWGSTPGGTAVADRLAAEGFTVLVPDLGGAAGVGGEEGAAAGRTLPVDHAARDLRGAVDLLLGHRAVTGTSIGAVGFRAGAGAVLALAVCEGDRIRAAVPFYGLPPAPGLSYGGLTADVLGHYGEHDETVPMSAVDRAAASIEEASGRKPEIHFYPAGHAFADPDNPLGTYDAEQAGIAWRRTIAFLHGHLG